MFTRRIYTMRVLVRRSSTRSDEREYDGRDSLYAYEEQAMIQATKQPRNVKEFVLAVLVLFAHVLSACAAPAAPGDAPAAPAAPAIATKSNPKDGAEYVYVPAGPFIMGSTEEQINDALRTCQKLIPTLTSHLRCQRSEFEREAPHSTIEVDGFWIMRTEVTNGQYIAAWRQTGVANHMSIS